MSALLRRSAGRITLLLSVALVAIVLPPTTAQAAVGDATFVGHGWGHGRGMGQYGALGYAVNYGWSSARMLDHFYGGTVAGNAGNPVMTVELTGLTGRDTIVTGSGLAINSQPVGPAALIRRTATGTFQVFTAPGCAGPWTVRPGLLGSGLTISTAGSQTVLGNLVRVCEVSGQRAYRGSLTVVSNGGTQRTINHVLTESYLRGVVPRESPASWGSLGSGKGMNALRAQAVAARSYALASNRIVNLARTCDTTACQVYGGAGFKTGTTLASLENPLTDTAISGTAGVVRLKSGVVARTEFSSSTGGYTAGGAFTAVVDAGDSITYNPNHTWTRTLALSAVAAKLGTGTIRTIGVTARNGLGADGGRTTNVRVLSTAGVVSNFTGNDVRSRLGLNSDWFSISSFTLFEAQSVVKALYADLLGRPVDPAGLATWSALLARGVGQPVLVASLTRSGEYVQRRVRQAYTEVLGRAPDPGGLTSWTRAIMTDTVSVDDVQRVFLTSQEFYLRSGGTSTGYVDLLYRTALKRHPTSSESAKWSSQIALVGRRAVLDGIWFSMEAAMYRAAKYYELFLKRVPDRAGQESWARAMLSQGEVAVRIGIAGSQEYRLLASKRFP